MKHVNEEGCLVSEKIDVIKMSKDFDLDIIEILSMIGVCGSKKIKAEIRYLFSEIESSKDLKAVHAVLVAAQGTLLESEALMLYKKCNDAILRIRLSKAVHSGDCKVMYTVYKDSIGTSVENEIWEEIEELYKK